jgi:hypothetical protein
MIIQMTNQFAEPETGMSLMGDRVYAFNPEYDYYYRPLSQSIETEHSKGIKIQRWSTILQSVIQIGHPDAVKMVNYIVMKIAQLMGEEYATFADMLLNPQVPIEQGGSPEAAGGLDIGAVSNQNMLPMSGAEVSARGGAQVGGA